MDPILPQEPLGPTIIKPDKTYKFPLIFVSLLLLVSLSAGGYFFYQTRFLKNEINTLDSKISSFDTEIASLRNDSDNEHLQYSELEGAVNGYLRKNGINCNEEFLTCLINLSKKNQSSSLKSATESSGVN